ncbi:hypothetical protein A9G26_06315 [Gilliamella sp. Bim1-2]|nr:hypothetical protein A9G25_00390 [Gilliamella apicola]OCG50679.1 hypothetical protein A9G26_06315 [Gilliamella apicola]
MVRIRKTSSLFLPPNGNVQRLSGSPVKIIHSYLLVENKLIIINKKAKWINERMSFFIIIKSTYDLKK